MSMSLEVVQVFPPSKVEKSPISVATYKVFGEPGRRAIARTGTCGSMVAPVPVIEVQVVPPSVVFQTLLEEKPPKVT
jgi:hypothetical protein